MGTGVRVFKASNTWRPRGVSMSVISRVVIGATPFRVLITLLTKSPGPLIRLITKRLSAEGMKHFRAQHSCFPYSIEVHTKEQQWDLCTGVGLPRCFPKSKRAQYKVVAKYDTVAGGTAAFMVEEPPEPLPAS